MKLTQRSFVNETKYSQSFGDFNNRRNKLLSTGFTNNTMNTSMRLPKLSRSLSTTSAKSAKQRVQIINQQADSLRIKVDQLRLDTRQSRRYVNFLRDDLADRQLNQHKNQLLLQIKKFQGAFKFSRKQSQDRTAAFKLQCKELAINSKGIIHMVQSLNCRIDILQETMGVYSGKEKHKF